jgi:hypothetical protein
MKGWCERAYEALTVACFQVSFGHLLGHTEGIIVSSHVLLHPVV